MELKYTSYIQQKAFSSEMINNEETHMKQAFYEKENTFYG